MFNTKQVYTCSYLCLLAYYIPENTSRDTPPPPPRKISNFWLEFEKYEQYMCSKNQINNITRLFKTLPQRKKPVLYQRPCRSQFPPWYPLFGLPPYIFPCILLLELRGAVHSIIQSNVDSRLNEKEYNFSNSSILS